MVDEGRGGTFPLGDGLFGELCMPVYGLTMGLVLHLRSGERSLRLAAVDHRPPPTIRLDAPAVDKVDVYLSGPDFDALARMVRGAWSLSAVRPEWPVRLALIDNRASVAGLFRMMAPWLATMVLEGVVAGTMGALGLLDDPVGQGFAFALSVGIVVAGLGLTIYRSARRPAPVVYLEAYPNELRVVDAATGDVLSRGARGAFGVSYGVHTSSGRGGEFRTPVISLAFAGAKPLTVNVPDQRFTWSDGAPRVFWAARYSMGSVDWLTLVELLGLRPHLAVTPYG